MYPGAQHPSCQPMQAVHCGQGVLILTIVRRRMSALCLLQTMSDLPESTKAIRCMQYYELSDLCMSSHGHACTQAAEGLHATGGRELQAKLKELVRHIRENKLRMTFTDALGQAQSRPDGINSQKEARRLAFYLFWNVRTDYDRQVAPKAVTHAPQQ